MDRHQVGAAAGVSLTAIPVPRFKAQPGQAHEDAAYNHWLAGEIQASIDDPRPNIHDDELMAGMDADIAALPHRVAPAGPRGFA